jgi:hypothetical protein
VPLEHHLDAQAAVRFRGLQRAWQHAAGTAT